MDQQKRKKCLNGLKSSDGSFITSLALLFRLSIPIAIVIKECVGFGVAGGEGDVGLGGSGFQERFDGFGGAAVLPVGVGGGSDGELECGAVVSVEGVDGGSGFDEELDGGGLGPPGGYVEGGAVAGDFEVWVAWVEGGGADSEREEMTDACGVVVAGELG